MKNFLQKLWKLANTDFTSKLKIQEDQNKSEDKLGNFFKTIGGLLMLFFIGWLLLPSPQSSSEPSEKTKERACREYKSEALKVLDSINNDLLYESLVLRVAKDYGFTPEELKEYCNLP